MSSGSSGGSRYTQIIEQVFWDHYEDGETSLEFEREELLEAADALGIDRPRNVGDVVYSVRYRTSMPDSVMETAPAGKEWVIEGMGRAKYAFRLTTVNRILPNPMLAEIKIPDSTPEIVSAYSLSDEQALLAKVRYNRLVDVFLGLAAYSLQNHLRTTVKSMGQVEIDELYAGVDQAGRQYVLPVQAKGGSDQLSVVQTKQDLVCCAEKFPNLICRALSAQFVDDNLIAMFELSLQDDEIRVMHESHYRLVPADGITPADLRSYAESGRT